MLPEVAGRRVAEGAAYLVKPSNDTWLDDQMYSNLQFDIVATRAIEQRRYLVRASTSGPSAIVDPWGRVQARTEPLTRRPRRDRAAGHRALAVRAARRSVRDGLHGGGGERARGAEEGTLSAVAQPVQSR